MNRRGFVQLGAGVLADAAFRRRAQALVPEGQLSWGVHFSLAPAWFDPADTAASVTPYKVLYALHDAAVKAMPGQPMAPSLAASWTVAADGRSWEILLRPDVAFHNGELVTAEDVKFSLERYRGASATMFRDNVRAVDVLGPRRVRFVLRQPWPDFMTFYSTATGAGWIVPRKYVESVGDDGFKKAPVGAGPYRFVAFTPGVELVLEAFEKYWRKSPRVRRLVFKVIPDDATRLAALARGEVDIVYVLRGPLAEALQATPRLTLKPTTVHATFWIYFPEQWDPGSPWHDRRVRLAVNHAINRAATDKAENLGHSKLSGSIVPSTFEFYWQPPAYAYDPSLSRRLLAAAGHPGGFDAGDYFCDASYASLAEAITNDLKAVGIRTRLRPLERAAFDRHYAEKKLKNVIQGAGGAPGNAATRLESFVVSNGLYAYGGYADIDALFRQQASELDRPKREATLHRIQRLVHEKVMFAPIWELVALHGIGPRVRESGLGLIPGYPYSAPYEELALRT